jgi:hypothetical protein
VGCSIAYVRTQLREFLARVSGNDIERVHVVSGERTIPEMPAGSVSGGAPIDELLTLDLGRDLTPNRYAALVAHPIARGVRRLFTLPHSAPVAKLSDICSTIFGHSDSYTRTRQNEALKWLDLLSSTVSGDGTPFLPLRSHIFHQTLAGLWCCSDRMCPGKSGSHLDEQQWPFGMLHLEPKRHCKCGSPVFELVACNDCGAIYLHAEVEGNHVVQPEADSSVDEFALDLDESSEEEEPQAFELSGSRSLLLVTNRDLLNCGVLHVEKRDGSIIETACDKSLDDRLRGRISEHALREIPLRTSGWPLNFANRCRRSHGSIVLTAAKTLRTQAQRA